MQADKTTFIVAQTRTGDEPFVEELHFSTADLERQYFYGAVREYHLYSEEIAIVEKSLKFRLIDGELFRVEEERTPPNARPLREGAGIFRITRMQE